MGKCINHTDRETSYLCMKHNIYLCEECLKCRDPEIYCKFRSSCPIWFLSKRKQKWETKDKEAIPTSGLPRVTFSNQDKQVEVQVGATDYIDTKALGYKGDPIIFGGCFKKLPLGTGESRE